MKGMHPCLLISLSLLAAPCAQADDWDAYSQWWTSHYYSFDPRAFTSISCDVSSSYLDQGTAGLLTSHPSVKAEPSLYQVSVDNSGTIHISDPALRLTAVDPSGTAVVPLVAELIQSKYQYLAESTSHNIRGILELLTPPQRKKTVIEKFTLDSDGSAVVQRKDLEIDGTATETIRGPELSVQTSQSATFGGLPAHFQGLVKVHYEMVDGRYQPVLEEEDQIQQSEGTQAHLVIETHLDYQLISGIRFPKTADFTDGANSDLMGTEDKFEFRDCKVTK